jgi:hypothetical protein
LLCVAQGRRHRLEISLTQVNIGKTKEVLVVAKHKEQDDQHNQ